jgi:hypothetical protein
MVMDAYSTIWVWVGKGASAHEKKKVAERIDTYTNAVTDGRTPDKIQISFINPCQEPFQFKALFPEWEKEISDKWVDQKAAQAQQ